MKGRPKEGRHPNFKGGRIINSNKYAMIFVGKHHHLADIRGYAYEHRIVAEEKIGRRLNPEEQVHHIDENTFNNAPDNLKVMKDFKTHRHEHGKKNNKAPDEENVQINCACGCGGTLLKYDSVNRPRQYIRGHNAPKSEVEVIIINCIKNGVNQTSEIAKFHHNADTVQSTLSEMVKKGILIRIKRATYGLQLANTVD